MILGIEHIGIAVNRLSESDDLFCRILGRQPYKKEDVKSESVVTSFFDAGNTKIELLEAIDGEGAIAGFLKKRGEGIHHIAFAVDDIKFEIDRLVDEGLIPLMKEPKKGADNKLVFFFHPKSTGGVLIELCQEILTETAE